MPTEIQWEAAAQGPISKNWTWGNKFDSKKSNLIGTEDDFPSVAPVGSFPSGVSSSGAQDMTGNVWEWVSRDLNNFSRISLNIKNIGYQNFNELQGTIPTQIQFGSSFNLPFSVKFNFDTINTLDKGTDLIFSDNLMFFDTTILASSYYYLSKKIFY